jgi:DNA primase large subunit
MYYPFLKSEKDRLKTLDLKIEDIASNPLYTTALDNAALDIIGKAKEPEDRDFAIVQFVLSKIFLSIIDNPAATEKYAEDKSEFFREKLEKESLTFLIKIAREDFGMLMMTEDTLRIDFKDFLKHKPDFLKLSQMNLLRGYVQVTKNQLTWILKGAIKQQIIDSIPKGTNFPESLARIANKVKGKAVEVRGKIQRPRISRLTTEALPPCIRDIISAMESGKANHNAHFVLVTFLHGLGLDENAILEVFKRSPKFKENIALYQIRFSKERGYTAPACDSIKSYGLCTGECPKNHPISNYFTNLRSIKYKRNQEKNERQQDTAD